MEEKVGRERTRKKRNNNQWEEDFNDWKKLKKYGEIYRITNLDLDALYR
jgi:hypothetical protein